MEQIDSKTLFMIAFIILTLIAILGFIMHLLYSRRIKVFKDKSISLESSIKVLEERSGHLQASADAFKTEINQKQTQLDSVQNEKQGLMTQTARLKADFQNMETKYAELQKDDESKKQAFENIANKVLNQQSQSLALQQTKGMEAILNPLKEKIASFEQKVERSSSDFVRGNASLKEQIINLQQQSAKVGEDANNLAKALKGDFKKQGNWGEIILESVLEKSGLEKGREYSVQVAETDHEGNRRYPDVVLNLPGGKKYIIDSKVSLRAYDGAVGAETEEEMNGCLKAHSLAIKNHIDGLAAKNYHDLYEMESPDFVLMFVPIDTAFSAALKHNSDLYAYAHEKNVIVVTPSTLLATLKTVESLWRNEKQNKNALAIAAEAGKMYDKFCAFVQDMEKIGKQLGTVQKSYDDSMKKLSSGSGNLVRRAEKLKTLGAKANKSLGDIKVLPALDQEAA